MLDTKFEFRISRWIQKLNSELKEETLGAIEIDF